MFGIRSFLFGALLGGGATYCAHHYHVVQTADEFLLVPRSDQIALRSSYVDVRGWDLTRWNDYPDVSVALLKQGREDLILRSMLPGGQQPGGQTPVGAAASGGSAGPFGTSPAQGGTMPFGSAAAGAAGPSQPDRPLIVFDPALQTAVPTPAAAAAESGRQPLVEDDSLLGRLRRQLQSPPTESPPPAGAGSLPATSQFGLQERPLLRDSGGAPSGPAASPVGTPSPQFLPAFDPRAELTPQRPPEQFLPSIHAAALDRLGAELQGALPIEPAMATQGDGTLAGILAQTQHSLREGMQFAPARTAPSAAAAPSQPLVSQPLVRRLFAEAAAPPAAAPLSKAAPPSAVEKSAPPPSEPGLISPAATTPAPAAMSQAAGHIPVQVDPRLREQLPAGLQDGFRLLLPE